VVDADQVDFFNLKVDKGGNEPVFVLNNVNEFSAARCDSIADVQVSHADHQELKK